MSEVKAERTAQEILAEAMAEGKQVYCAVPMAIGAKCLVLDPRGELGGGFEISISGVTSYDKREVYQLFIRIRDLLEAHADTDELRGLMGIMVQTD